MSTSDNPPVERTPAPAGSMSRIFDSLEAEKIGMSPWLIEDSDSPRLTVSARAYNSHAGSQAAADSDTGLKEIQLRHKKELDEATQRTRNECETRTQSMLQMEVEPWLKRMAQSIEDIATVKHRYLAESEEQLVRLAIAVARRILYREIQVDSEALFGLIHAATQRAELRELNRILLNPKDHQSLRPHLERLQLPPRVQIVSDPALERGAMLLESTSGILDASIQAQLDEVERGFIDLLGRRG